MSKYKVIFDTNAIHKPDFKIFLGYRNELEEFKKHCEIIIPDMVIDEIKKQKYKAGSDALEDIKKNIWYEKLSNDSETTLQEVDIENEIIQIEGDETLSYQVITLQNKAIALDKMRELALNGDAPFAEKNNTGFKDAYIYMTICEYFEQHKNEKIFVVTKDKRFSKVLKKLKGIVVVENFEEFQSHIIEQYQGSYFIDKLKKEVSEDIEPKHLFNFWKSKAGYDILLVETPKIKIALKIDENEILDAWNIEDLQKLIDSLICSESYASTHNAIDALLDYVDYFSDDEIKKLLNACYENGQIYRIMGDDDVKGFMLQLYENKEYLVEEDVKRFIETIKLPNA